MKHSKIILALALILIVISSLYSCVSSSKVGCPINVNRWERTHKFNK